MWGWPLEAVEITGGDGGDGGGVAEWSVVEWSGVEWRWKSGV